MRYELGQLIIEFCGTRPEFWAYVAAYDWVALRQLYGRLVDGPEHWPKFCRDLKQYHKETLPEVSLLAKPGTPHKALGDARWVRDAHEELRKYRMMHVGGRRARE